MTNVKVINKFINVLPIQTLLNQGESLVDDIYFHIDNYVDGVDFSDWSWRLYYQTPLDDGYTVLLDSQYDSENKKVILHWIPDINLSKKAGYTTIQIRGSKDTDDGLLKWNSAVATIRINRSLEANEDDPHQPILEEYLDRIEQLCQSGIVDYQLLAKAILDESTRATAKEQELEEEINRLKLLIPGGQEDVTVPAQDNSED